MSNLFYTTAADLEKCHLTIEEVRCKEADGSPCRDCGGQAKILVETAWGFATVREALGVPIVVSSGYRCTKHQQRIWDAEVKRVGSIYKARQKVAKPGTSAHEYAAALDCATPRGFTPGALRKAFEVELHGDCRTGLYPWGVHFDRAHLLQPNPNPVHFRKGVRW